jgi:hypothetical protein
MRCAKNGAKISASSITITLVEQHLLSEAASYNACMLLGKCFISNGRSIEDSRVYSSISINRRIEMNKYCQWKCGAYLNPKYY